VARELRVTLAFALLSAGGCGRIGYGRQGAPRDAATDATDATRMDAGGPGDASLEAGPPDSAVPLDAGPPPDSAVALDSAVPPDSAVPLDAGPPLGPRLFVGWSASGLLRDGGLVAWGNNFAGQLGDGTTTNRSAPVAAMPGGALIDATGGNVYTCGVLTSGSVRCWGGNTFGQLGDGTTTDSVAPVGAIGLSGATRVFAGLTHTCATTSDPGVWCWGDNSRRQVGVPPGPSVTAPARLDRLTGVPIRYLALGEDHSCALLESGDVQCWGSNASGQLGNPGAPFATENPVPVVGLVDAVALAAGGGHSCAIRAGGAVVCWGRNSNGQLGDGTTTDRPTITPVGSLAGVAAIGLGNAHSCAVLYDGTARCWGYGGEGQLGNGRLPMAEMTPVVVSGLTDAVSVDGGVQHTCALRVGGRVSCWGNNSSGELGDATTVWSSAPVAVSGL